jgi:hypothetical protein
MVILCIKFFIAVVLATEAVVKVDEAVVASLAAAVTLDIAGKLELVLAHQKIPPMMARMIMPDITYMLEPIDGSDFMIINL